MPDKQNAEKATEEEIFFSQYADIYTEPEVVWLSRVIERAGLPASPDSIARVVLAAGYRRASSISSVSSGSGR